MHVDKTFNLHCIVCGDKKTTKTSKYIWITVEECTEMQGDDGSLDDDGLPLLQ